MTARMSGKVNVRPIEVGFRSAMDSIPTLDQRKPSKTFRLSATHVRFPMDTLGDGVPQAFSL
jgi:hypothetical protein